MLVSHQAVPPTFYKIAPMVVVQCVAAVNINYDDLSALHGRRPEQNINAKTEQFMTAKTSGNALKQEIRIHSVLLYVVSAVHNCQSTRLRTETVE